VNTAALASWVRTFRRGVCTIKTAGGIWALSIPEPWMLDAG